MKGILCVLILLSPPLICLHIRFDYLVKIFENWFIPDLNNKCLLYDKIYTFIHSTYHINLYQSNLYRNDNEPLLKDKIIKRHNSDNISCIRYQLQYIKLDMNQKINYIRKFHFNYPLKRLIKYYNINHRYISLIKCIICLYIISRFYMFIIFPCYWYFYEYFYKTNNMGLCNKDEIQCIENVFVSLFILIYFIYLIIFLQCLYKLLKYDYWFGYVIIYGNVRYDYKHESFLKILIRNKYIFEAINVGDIAIIICDYLGN